MNINTATKVLALESVGASTASSASTADKVQNAIGGDFERSLLAVLSQAAQTVRNGEVAATAGIAGTMPVQQVAEAVMAAEHAVQFSIALRDKIIAAYTELSRMQI